jgi:hypothetical protein
MGEICCGARVGASPRPPVKVIETKIVLPNELLPIEQKEKLPKFIALGVLDHVTAPQMVRLKETDTTIYIYVFPGPLCRVLQNG